MTGQHLLSNYHTPRPRSSLSQIEKWLNETQDFFVSLNNNFALFCLKYYETRFQKKIRPNKRRQIIEPKINIPTKEPKQKYQYKRLNIYNLDLRFI